MSALKDMTGLKFGSLTVIGRAKNDVLGKSRWICKCDCGNMKVVRGENLRQGASKTCGCSTKIDGRSNDRLYNVYSSMIKRCYDKNNKSYKNYGGRGIRVCREWLDDYQSFKSWSYDNGYDDAALKHKCTIDRIDVNGNYCPENCRWVGAKEQCNNKRNNHTIEFNGRTLTMKQWSEELGINYFTLANRINNMGMSIEDALTVPVGQARGISHAHNNEYYNRL